MQLLGINGLNHDPSVALLRDANVLFAVESEKVTRHKREMNACPDAAVRLVLQHCRTTIDDVDYIVTSWDASPLRNVFYFRQLLAFMVNRTLTPDVIMMLLAIAGSHSRLGLSKLDSNALPQIRRVPHHLAHLGGTYTLSGFDDAAVAIVDGSGELECTSLFSCYGRNVRCLRTFNLPLNSLGHVYTAATRHLGFGIQGDEFKVMGMAAYGSSSPRYRGFFERLIPLLDSGGYRVDRALAGGISSNLFRFPRSTGRMLPITPIRPGEFAQEHFDFAYELQRRLEEVLLHVLRNLRAVTQHKKLCMSGGVALNSVANARIADEAGFDEVFIQPASNDAGTSLGAAAYFSYHVLGGQRPISPSHAFLGPSFSDETIEDAIRRTKVKYARTNTPAECAARHLNAGKVVGWFQGPSEFGPRALGNRSILCDPRRSENRDRVNQLKGREWFRPLAPAVLEECSCNYFEMTRKSPFMLLVAKVREEVRDVIPAVTHVDGSARVQTVSIADNPLFYRLIEAFAALSGVPVVLNTSFNLADEPMVSSPFDALRTFFSSSLDVLVMGSFMIEKEPPQ